MITELSILIPTYNRQCLGLVKELQRQAQHIPSLSYEILVADDGSTDTEAMETNRAVNMYKDCKLMECGTNRGRARIRNFLAESARYGRLLFLDSDVSINNGSFIANYLNESEAEVVCGGVALPYEKEKYAGNLRYRYERACASRFSAEARTANPYRGFRTTNFMIRQDVMLSHLFSREVQGYGYEDVLFGKELCEDRIEIRHIDNPVCIDDFEPNPLFLEKAEESCRTLYSLRNELEGYSGLLKLAETVKNMGMAAVADRMFGKMRKALVRNLTGNNPSVLLYNIYRAGYLISHAVNNQTGNEFITKDK